MTGFRPFGNTVGSSAGNSGGDGPDSGCRVRPEGCAGRSEGQAPAEIDADRRGLRGQCAEQRGGSDQDGGDTTSGTHGTTSFSRLPVDQALIRTSSGCPATR